MNRLIIAAAVMLLVPIGCGTDDAPAKVPGTCAEDKTLGDACTGVPSEPMGDTSACTTIHSVATASELDAALSGTSPGDCIVLKAGSYAAVVLPDGVSVYGESADSVTVAGITVTSGTIEVADLTIESGTVTVQTAAVATLSGTRILNSDEDGLVLEAGAAATVRRSEIEGAGRYGVSAFDAGSLDLDGNIIDNNGGPGVWISCSAGCNCSGTVTGTIRNTVIRNNRVVGIAAVGADLTIENVLVSDTTVGSSFDAGGGFSVSACSTVSATDLTITRNADFGMLVDDSSLSLNRATIDDNLRGLWVQGIGATRGSDSVRVSNAVFTGNEGVGFGIDQGAINVSIETSQITDTKMVPLPVLVNGVSANVLDVGDGLAWLGASQVTVTDVTLSNNARVGILIDGPVASGSAIANLVSSGTSGTLDVLQQNLPSGGEQPATSGTTPAIESDTSERLAIPDEIAIPPSI
jgi:hypothetical protein